MKKLIKLLVILVALFVIACIGVVIYANTIAKSAIERGATYALGVPTTVSAATIGIVGGEFGLDGLKVANPEGYDQPHFLKLDDADVDLTLRSLLEETVELPNLTLKGLDVNLEKKSDKANYQVILDNLKKFESGDRTPPKDGKKFVIRTVEISDVVVHVDMIPLGGDATRIDVPIERIELKDVGSGGKPLQLAELSNVIIKAVFAALVSKGGGLIPGDVLGGLQGGLDGLSGLGDMGVGAISVGGEALQGALGELGKEAEKALEGAGDIGKEAGEGVGKALEGLGGVLGGGKDKDPDEAPKNAPK
jgi:hypothetical protein